MTRGLAIYALVLATFAIVIVGVGPDWLRIPVAGVGVLALVFFGVYAIGVLRRR